MSKCSICGKDIRGFGNNAWQISKEICCDVCNLTIVIPERIKLSTEKVKKL
jgi:hypothetical protein